MLRIRLSRRGKKRQPHYRVVVAEVTSRRDGRFVESIGYYSPLTDPETVKIAEDRALYWLSVGAQPSEAVERLLKNQGTFDRLPRLRAGEPIDALVAEFEGRPWPPEAEPEPTRVEAAAAVVEDIVEDVEAAVEDVAEAAESTVEDVAEAADAAAEGAAAAVEDVVAAATDAVADTVEAVAEAVTDEADEAAEAPAADADDEAVA